MKMCRLGDNFKRTAPASQEKKVILRLTQLALYTG